MSLVAAPRTLSFTVVLGSHKKERCSVEYLVEELVVEVDKVVKELHFMGQMLGWLLVAFLVRIVFNK